MEITNSHDFFALHLRCEQKHENSDVHKKRTLQGLLTYCNSSPSFGGWIVFFFLRQIDYCACIPVWSKWLCVSQWISNLPDKSSFIVFTRIFLFILFSKIGTTYTQFKTRLLRNRTCIPSIAKKPSFNRYFLFRYTNGPC